MGPPEWLYRSKVKQLGCQRAESPELNLSC
jgi:hypothetical protein